MPSMISADSDRRDALARQLAMLFSVAAAGCNAREIAEFDDLFHELAQASTPETLAFVSAQLAPLANAPHSITLKLARSEIEIARPILIQSVVLTDDDLVLVCEDHGNGHMEAIAQRASLSSHVSDVLVFRGDDLVRTTLVRNRNATISTRAFSRLAGQARSDETMEQILVERPDLPGVAVHILVKFGTRISRDALAPTASRPAPPPIQVRGRQLDGYDFDAARARIEQLSEQGQLGEQLLMRCIAEDKFPEAVVVLSQILGVRLDDAKSWYMTERPDALLVATKAYGLEARTVFGLLGIGPWKQSLDVHARQAAVQRFQTLSKVKAVKLLGEWRKSRHAASRADA